MIFMLTQFKTKQTLWMFLGPKWSAPTAHEWIRKAFLTLRTTYTETERDQGAEDNI